MRVESTTTEKEGQIVGWNVKAMNGRKCKQKTATNVAGLHQVDQQIMTSVAKPHLWQYLRLRQDVSLRPSLSAAARRAARQTGWKFHAAQRPPPTALGSWPTAPVRRNPSCQSRQEYLSSTAVPDSVTLPGVWRSSPR